MTPATRQTLTLFLGWFLILNLFALAANNRLRLPTDTAYHWIENNPAVFHQEQSWNPVRHHDQWDSYWYLDIAQRGYRYEGPERISNIAFFPLYPALIRAVSSLGVTPAIAGWLISTAALLLALLQLQALIREHHPELDPQQAQIFLLLFPTAFYLNAVYTESLFLLLSLLCFRHMLTGHFVLAGAIGLAAACTRVTGLLLIVPLALEYCRQHGLRWRWPAAPAVLLPALGTAGFFTYHGMAFGDFTAWLKVQDNFGRGFSLTNFQWHNPAAMTNQALDFLFLVFAVALVIGVWRRFRASYALYMLATLAVALSSGTTMSLNRYLLVLFPIYLLAAALRNTELRRAWQFASTLLLALTTLLFVNGHWAG
jgi:hypothetical protein